LFDIKLADVPLSARGSYNVSARSAHVPRSAELRDERLARDASPDIFIELAHGERLSEIRQSWIELLERTDEPNVFMDPALVRAAADAYPETGCAALLAWRHRDERPQLVGVWAFAVGFARPSAVPVRVLTVPPFQHGYAATPVLDRDCRDEALDAMLERIAADPHLPKIVSFDAMAIDGPAMAALTRVLRSRGSVPRILDRALRPRLESELAGKDYLDKALSSSRRKKLRQHRRRLSEKGEFASVVTTDPQAVRRALEQFLQMEASGWKGRQHTALLCSDADASFARAAVGTLADQGRACIHALCIDDRPVSMQIVLRAGAAAFTWKIAYDEKLHDVSPGMLLLEDYTAAFLDDAGIAFVNSCTHDDSGFMSVWTEREAIANLWIDARRGSSVAFEFFWRLQKTYCGLRALIKSAYLTPRRLRARK